MGYYFDVGAEREREREGGGGEFRHREEDSFMRKLITEIQCTPGVEKLEFEVIQYTHIFCASNGTGMIR